MGKLILIFLFATLLIFSCKHIKPTFQPGLVGNWELRNINPGEIFIFIAPFPAGNSRHIIYTNSNEYFISDSIFLNFFFNSNPIFKNTGKYNLKNLSTTGNNLSGFITYNGVSTFYSAFQIRNDSLTLGDLSNGNFKYIFVKIK